MITLTVNGFLHRLDIDPATPLLYALRGELGLNGAKFGCGLGQCGACTVIVEGAPVFACLLPVAALQDRQVTTIEGLGTAEPGRLPDSLAKEPMLDAWIRIDADGAITVFTGKAELGQGVKTALIQLAAEELMVKPEAVRLVTADTAQTPNEGYTAGSNSMQDSGVAIRHAAAQARMLLIGEAAKR